MDWRRSARRGIRRPSTADSECLGNSLCTWESHPLHIKDLLESKSLRLQMLNYLVRGLAGEASGFREVLLVPLRGSSLAHPQWHSANCFTVPMPKRGIREWGSDHEAAAGLVFSSDTPFGIPPRETAGQTFGSKLKGKAQSCTSIAKLMLVTDRRPFGNELPKGESRIGGRKPTPSLDLTPFAQG